MRGKAERRLVSELTLPDALETFFKLPHGLLILLVIVEGDAG